MKFIIFILAITVLHISQAQTGDWAPVSSPEINTSPEIQGLLEFGVKYIEDKAIKDLTVPDTPYQVAQVYNVSRLITDNGVDYQISVNLDNGEGTKINATFIVQFQPSRNRVRVSKYSYHYTITETACSNEDANLVGSDDEDEDEEVYNEEETYNEEEAYNEEETHLLGGWFDVDPDELNSDKEIKDLLDYGANRVIEAAVKDGKIPNNQYQVVNLYKILAQILSGTKYKFYVKLDDGKGTTVKAIFVVYYQSWTGRKDLTCYRYAAFTNKTQEENNEEEVIPTEEKKEEEQEQEAQEEQEQEAQEEQEQETQEEQEQEAQEEQEQEQETQEEQEEETSTLPGGWSNVPMSEVENSDVIQSLLNYGADYVIQKAIDAGKIPDTNYDVVQINSVLSQVVSGINYKFDVKLDNGEGTTVNATYVVWYQAWTDTKKVESYVYNSFTKELDCQDADPDKIDYPPETEEELNEESNEEQTITADYSVVDNSVVEDNEDVQHFLDLGVAYVLQEGKKAGKIPNSDFQVSEIYRIWRRDVDGIKYKFHVKLDNGKGVTVNTIFVVYSEAWTGQTKVSCDRYSVHTKKK